MHSCAHLQRVRIDPRAQVEGLPLYRYQLRLRLARALDLLAQYDDLTSLGLELGFSSHSHFSTLQSQHSA